MKIIIKFFLINFLAFFSVCTVFAKDISISFQKKQSYYQHLEWESSGVVKEYELIIEKENGQKYDAVKTIKTKNTYYDITLSEGKYRYTVIFYNVFGQKAFQTDYKNFNVGSDTKTLTLPISLEGSFGYLLGGIVADDFYETYFETTFVPWNLYTDFRALYEVKDIGPVKNIGKFGLGLIFRESYLKNNQSEIEVKGNLFSFNLNVVYNRKVYSFDFGDLFVEAYTGFGFSFLSGLTYYIEGLYSTDKLTSVLPCYDIGAKVMFEFYEHICAECGLEFNDAFAVKNADYSLKNLSAIFGIGVKY